jgi:hypothetical protein
MSSTKRCTYCSRPLTSDTSSPEHIILHALGGKRSSVDIVCRDCNNRLGSQVDKSLPESLELIRCMLDIPGHGGPTARARGVSTGREYRVHPGGEKELLDVEAPKDVPASRAPSEPVRISGARDKVESVLDGLSRKHGPVRIESAESVIYREPLTPIRKTQLGGPEQERSIMKMALNLVAEAAEQFGLSVFDEAFRPARRFVSEGHPFVPRACQIDSRPLFALPPVSGAAFYNRVSVFCDPKAGNVIAAVEVLSELRFSVLLARQYDGEPMAFSITNLPLERGADEIRNIGSVVSIDTNALLDRGSDQEWLETCQCSFERLLERVMTYDQNRFISEAICSAARAAGGDASTTENMDRFCTELAERLVEGLLPPGRVIRQRYRDPDHPDDAKSEDATP